MARNRRLERDVSPCSIAAPEAASSVRAVVELVLERISKRVGGQTWLHPMHLELESGAVTVLLGATQAGKTSLMRIMAGLDVPTEGRVRADGVDVTGMPVRERNVAMVYQQFINYPSLTVADNIASPLKLRGDRDVAQRVRALAERLHIEMFLDRYPAELSGGQQQRVALARALAKGAPLMLLDEPLVNLDYKLREELREELTQLFATGDSTRSEEHTSELQSQSNLVCRLLLEKKKNKQRKTCRTKHITNI